MKEISITEFARGLSEFINRVTYRGETFAIVRGGKAVAQLTPAPTGARVKDLAAIFDSLPPLEGDDVNAFEKEIREARAALNEPVRDRWGS